MEEQSGRGTLADAEPLVGQSGACPACGASGSPGEGAGKPSYVYAIGRIEVRFPDLSIEKEFAQAASRADTKGLTDRQLVQAVLSTPENRYLVRRLCWVFTIKGLETYILLPRDPGDFRVLAESLRPNPTPLDLDVVIGMKGPVARGDGCGGLMLPVVAFDHLYSFDRAALIKSIPRPEKSPQKDFASASEELFDRIIQITDNAGSTNESRAVNYLAVCCGAIYAHTAEAFARNESLTAVEVRPSSLSGPRDIVDVIFTYTNRGSGFVEKSFVRVDVHGEFPFLHSPLSHWIDR